LPAKIEVKKNAAGQFYWRFKSANGEIVATSEAYVTKQGCLKGIDSIRRDAANSPIQDMTTE
jgi:uncharacterized protein YegP (UPF0339 family)